MFGARRRGQSTLEYVFLIIFVVSALIAAGLYMKRGVQGKLRESTDQVGGQYSARQTSGEYIITSQTDQTEKMLGKGATETTFADENLNYQTKTGNETRDIIAEDEK